MKIYINLLSIQQIRQLFIVKPITVNVFAFEEKTAIKKKQFQKVLSRESIYDFTVVVIIK